MAASIGAGMRCSFRKRSNIRLLNWTPLSVIITVEHSNLVMIRSVRVRITLAVVAFLSPCRSTQLVNRS